MRWRRQGLRFGFANADLRGIKGGPDAALSAGKVEPQAPVGPVEPRVGSRAEAGLREAVEGVGAPHGRETSGLSGEKVPHAPRPGSMSRIPGAPTSGKSDPADDAHPAASPFQLG